jgi:hypothetical protein
VIDEGGRPHGATDHRKDGVVGVIEG